MLVGALVVSTTADQPLWNQARAIPTGAMLPGTMPGTAMPGEVGNPEAATGMGLPPAAAMGDDLTEEEMEQYLRAYKARKGPGRQRPGQPAPQQMTAAPVAPVPMVAGANSPQTGSAGELIGFSGFNGSGSQTITLVHAGKMQIAVYHIDGSGQLQLISSRPIDADYSITLTPTAP